MISSSIVLPFRRALNYVQLLPSILCLEISSVISSAPQSYLHRILKGDGTVANAAPCNHRWKYLDGQWEDSLYVEEPGYVVVRREIESSGTEDNG